MSSSSIDSIATLGPEGTDSENAARLIREQLNLGADIVLCESFAKAEEYASSHRGFFLIPAAYTRKDSQGNIVESWADVNFRLGIEGTLSLHSSHVLPLQEMCIARRADAFDPRTIVLHPSTEMFAKVYEPNLDRLYINSKPTVVKACSEGRADKCIGSSVVVQQFGNLEIEKRFNPTMVWTLYGTNN